MNILVRFETTESEPNKLIPVVVRTSSKRYTEDLIKNHNFIYICKIVFNRYSQSIIIEGSIKATDFYSGKYRLLTANPIEQIPIATDSDIDTF